MGSMGGMSGMGGMMGGSGTSSTPTRSGNRLMGTSSALLGGDAGDVYYPDYLINGKPKTDPAVFTGKPGSRVRIRLINAGSDTAFRFALGGHRLTVTHTDGYPVQPTEVDGVLIGMGERYDVLVTLGDGAFPLVAQAEGKNDRAFAVVRTGGGAAPSPDVQVPGLSSTQIATASILTADPTVALASKSADRSTSLSLTGGMMNYDWGINGRRFDAAKPLDGATEVRQGERVRLTVQNQTMMWHPFHLHGHTFQLAGGGPRKDTAIVLPGKSLIVDFDADNPGIWAAHCHNIYHAETGMMTMVGYAT
jgi:FtsP/CotA-like multicopper oxidase with cupredoxin domain